MIVLVLVGDTGQSDTVLKYTMVRKRGYFRGDKANNPPKNIHHRSVTIIIRMSV